MTAFRTTATAFLAAAGIAMTAPALAAAGAAGPDRGQNLSLYEQSLIRPGSTDRNGNGDRTSREAPEDFRRAYNRDWRHDGERGRNYRWDDHDWNRNGNKDKGYRAERRHWHYNHHPQYRRWVGHRVPAGRYVEIYDYRYYGLPAPRRGNYYVRQNDDVFLVAEASRLIIDAFVLLNAASR